MLRYDEGIYEYQGDGPKCTACGMAGHKSTNRECPLYDQTKEVCSMG